MEEKKWTDMKILDRISWLVSSESHIQGTGYSASIIAESFDDEVLGTISVNLNCTLDGKLFSGREVKEIVVHFLEELEDISRKRMGGGYNNPLDVIK